MSQQQVEKGNGFTSAASTSSGLSASDPQVTGQGIAGSAGMSAGIPGQTAPASGDPQITGAGIAGSQGMSAQMPGGVNKTAVDTITPPVAMSDAEKALQGVIQRSAAATGQAVVEGLKPLFQHLTETLKTAITPAPAVAPTQDKDGDEKKNVTPESLVTEATKSLQLQITDFVTDLNKQMVELKTAVDGSSQEAKKAAKLVANSTPAHPPREETVSKSNQQQQKDDPNACFNQLWPNIGGGMR